MINTPLNHLIDTLKGSLPGALTNTSSDEINSEPTLPNALLQQWLKKQGLVSQAEFETQSRKLAAAEMRLQQLEALVAELEQNTEHN